MTLNCPSGVSTENPRYITTPSLLFVRLHQTALQAHTTPLERYAVSQLHLRSAPFPQRHAARLTSFPTAAPAQGHTQRFRHALPKCGHTQMESRRAGCDPT